MYEVRHYVATNGKDVYMEWRKKLHDHKAAAAIDRRLFRAEIGNFGDHKFLQDGISELRIDVGPGYRVYYAIEGKQIILLLCAGDKGTQSKDIERACEQWRDWQERIRKRREEDERSQDKGCD